MKNKPSLEYKNLLSNLKSRIRKIKILREEVVEAYRKNPNYQIKGTELFLRITAEFEAMIKISPRFQSVFIPEHRRREIINTLEESVTESMKIQEICAEVGELFKKLEGGGS